MKQFAGRKELEAEGDSLLARMQGEKQQQAIMKAFSATPKEMGEAAILQTRKRKA